MSCGIYLLMSVGEYTKKGNEVTITEMVGIMTFAIK